MLLNKAKKAICSLAHFSAKNILLKKVYAYLCAPIRKRVGKIKAKYRTAFASIQQDSVAQLVEQYTFNVWVLGSSPNGITSIKCSAL